MLNEEILTQFVAVIAGALSLGTAFFGFLRLGGFLITNMDKRNQRLSELLIEAKTSGLKSEVEALTIKLGQAEKDVTKLQDDAKRQGEMLQNEIAMRHQEAKRAVAAETREEALQKELNKLNIIIETLKSLFAQLNITVPEDGVTVVIGKQDEKTITDDVAAAAEQAIDELKKPIEGEEDAS